MVSEKTFASFSHSKYFGANVPWGGASLYPRGIIGRIYVKQHIKLLDTKYTSVESCGFRGEDFFHMFPFISICQINRIHHGWSVEIGKSQPEGPPVPVGNDARRVSHRNGGPEGWDFPFSTDHP